MENQIFALDIGTHSVVGILGSFKDDVFCAKDYARYFHKRGAMRDGQIEDISMVARAVTEVKRLLEERNDCRLSSAAIAAAGRLLLTEKVEYEQDLPKDSQLDAEMIRSLEYSALNAAVDQFTKGKDEMTAYSCVGYSVMGYWLDDYQYSNLEGHQGSHVKIQMIAAFLPFSVIRSLYAVTEKCGLKVNSLTLEPIAAINAIVPRDIRLLNIAIVDIGAGTSDIAISRNGSIVAYAMATIAGDEVTEALMRQFLVDFESAEKIKQGLSEHRAAISYENILGAEMSCTREEAFQAIEETIDILCKEIAKNILEINERAPVAVFLTGGGSQIPTLCQRIAKELEMPEERVNIGGQRAYKNIQVECEALLSPEFVTPLGIGVTYHPASGHDSFSITVNEEKIMFPQTNEIKVMDALLLAGIKASDLIGSNPRPLEFLLNGERKTIRGSRSMPGEIFRNGKIVSLNDPVLQGDDIKVVFAKPGEAPKLVAGDLVKELPEDAYVLINGEKAALDQVIQNGDMVEVVEPEAVQEQEASAEESGISEVERQPIETKEAETVFEDETRVEPEVESDVEPEKNPSQEEIAQNAEVPEGRGTAEETEKVNPRETETELEEIPSEKGDVPVKEVLPEEEEVEQKEEAIDFIEALRESMLAMLEETPEEEVKEEVKPVEVQEEEVWDLSTAIGIYMPEKVPEKKSLEEKIQEEKPVKEKAFSSGGADEGPLEGQVSFFPEENRPTLKVEEKKEEPKKPERSTLSVRSSAKRTIKVTLNGEPTEVHSSNGNHFQFLDLLNYVELDTKNPQGDLVLLLNGAPAGYMDPLLPGDSAEIRWSSEKKL